MEIDDLPDDDIPDLDKLLDDFLKDLLDKLGNRECNVNTTLSQIVGRGGMVDNDMQTLLASLKGQTGLMKKMLEKFKGLSKQVDKNQKGFKGTMDKCYGKEKKNRRRQGGGIKGSRKGVVKGSRGRNNKNKGKNTKGQRKNKNNKGGKNSNDKHGE